MLYVEADFMDFLESQDPYEFLTKFYKVSKLLAVNSGSSTLMLKQRKSSKLIQKCLKYLRTSESFLMTSNFVGAESSKIFSEFTTSTRTSFATKKTRRKSS
jgi:hypothetical protein